MPRYEDERGMNRKRRWSHDRDYRRTPNRSSFADDDRREEVDYPDFSERAQNMGHRDFGYSGSGYTNRSSSSYEDTDHGNVGFDRENNRFKDNDQHGRSTYGRTFYGDRGLGNTDYGKSSNGQTSFGNSRYGELDRMRGTSWGYGTDFFGDGRSGQRGEHYGKGPKGWKRSDERIREEVSEALYRAHDVDATDIEIDVKDGEVTLRGTVDGRDTKRAAESAVEYISGVHDVHNELKVKKEGGILSSIMGDKDKEKKTGTLS